MTHPPTSGADINQSFPAADAATGIYGVHIITIKMMTAPVMQAPRALELLLLPGLAFDAHGRRLGRGGGCGCICLLLLWGVLHTCGLAAAAVRLTAGTQATSRVGAT
jgi:5-formyltetrahydrofolate cyclo-ligase family